MTHLVVFKNADGKQAYHQSGQLDDALSFIAHLKNNQAVSKAKLFKLSEIPLEFKTVVKVEVAGSAAEPESTPDPVEAAAESEPVDEIEASTPAGDDVVPAEGAKEPVAAGGRRRLGR